MGSIGLPNGLSAVRIIATPIIMALLLSRWEGAYILALAVFAVAAITDTLDGYMARRQKLVSNLGIFLDLTADKILISAVLITMVELALLPSWLVVTIVGREFIVTGIRTYAAAEGIVIPAGPWGKRKTALTTIGVAAIILYGDLARGGWTAAFAEGNFVGLALQYANWLMYLVLLITVASGIQYLVRALPLLRLNPPRETKHSPK